MIQGTLGFLGFGNMGQAIAGGLIETGAMQPISILAYDADAAKRACAEVLGIVWADSTQGLAGGSDALLLAVKPQQMNEALEALKSGLTPTTLIISIAAGISIAYIQERLGAETRVVRVMPNTPAMVKTGAAGLAFSANCTAQDRDTGKTLFEAVGVAECFVEESQIDAVTALSGSGPAYFFYMVECLVAAAVKQGLPEAQAMRLAAQTLLGSGKLLMESGESAATLRQKVTSKGGTTEAALRTFSEQGFAEVIGAGVAAAALRARELGQ